MTVSSKVSSIIYSCDGVTTVFDVPFRFLEDSDLQLSIKSSDGSVSNLVLNSNYTVTGANEDGGGKVYLTHPAPAQSKLSILRVVDLLQETDYRENERFPAESHERALDKLTMEVQQLQEQSDRAIKVDVFSDVDPDVLIGYVERVWDSVDNIDIVADDKANIDTVASNIADVNTNVTNMPDINTNATNISFIKTNANNITDITTTASHISEVDIVSNNIADISNVSNSIGNVNTVANNSANVTTVATNISDVNAVVTNMAAIQAAPTAATNAANSAQSAQDAADKVQGLIATPIGTIFQSVYVDESLDIARQLNGQLISSTKFTGFRSWLNTVQTAAPNLFTTETNWQAEKTNSKLGQCGKFVVDDTAGTIRLPCVVNAQGLVDLALIGGIKNESLPNISGTLHANGGGVFNITASSGCFDVGTNFGTKPNFTSGDNVSNYTKFDASRSSSTYQDNAPVQQEAVQYPYYIQVSTGIDETLPAIREYNINTPFFFGQSMYSDVAPDNASWLASNGQWNARAVYPDYYDWLVEQVNTGVDDFITTNFRQYNAEETYSVWTNDAPPVVGMLVYSGYSVSQASGFRDCFPITAVSGNSITFMDTVANIEKTCTYSKTVPGRVWDSAFVVNQTNQTFRLPLLNGEEDLVGDRYDDLTLGESGTTYVAPANGYVAIGGPCSGYISLYNNNGKLISMVVPDKGNYQYARTFVPVSKGNVFGVDYAGLTADNFRFIYAKGNGSLYYYIGDTVQDASLINAGAVLNEVATLKANKADIDASNFNADGKSLLSGLGMPSDRYIDLTVGASSSQYTAPANGWVSVHASSTGAPQTYIEFVSDTSHEFGTSKQAAFNGVMRLCMPIKKNGIFRLWYNGASFMHFRFYYAEGEN